jgi:HAD superfamily hydrolase (TIGR01549 family)
LSKYQDKKLIAFDLYGTCVDHPFKNYRLSWELRDIMKTNSITLQDIQEWKIEKDWIKIKLDNEFIENIRKDIEWTFLFPETLEALKYIKSRWYKTAVVSNLSKDYAQPLHRLIPQWNFDYEVLSFDVWATKPDPKIYEYLKSISWIDFKDIIMIWDSLKADVIWSNNVWITPIHLNRDEEWIKEVDKKWLNFIQISTLSDLKEIL